MVTIDGPAASGKSSVSRELAKRLGWSWVSTGAFYRGLGYMAFVEKSDLENESSLVELVQSDSWQVKMTPEQTQFFYKGEDCTNKIFMEEVGNIASKVSQYPKVRESLLLAQRNMANEVPGLIAEGRDCGTVVFPAANLKVYLTASSDSRARRRAEEQGANLEKTIADQKQRDKQDSTRKAAPMQVPQGAHVVDTSELTLDQVVDCVEQLYKQTNSD